MFEVVYESISGNTRKLAAVIAEELGVEVEDVRFKAGLKKDTFVLLGSGCYATKPGKKIMNFIESNDFEGRDVALFGASGGGDGEEVRGMEKLLVSKGAHIEGSYYCRGRAMLLFGRGHPSDKELAGARDFAGEIKLSHESI